MRDRVQSVSKFLLYARFGCMCVCVGKKLWLDRIFVGYGAVIAGGVAVFAELICYGANG